MSTSSAASRSALLVTGASLLYVFLWASGFVAIKFGLKSCPPLTFVSVRFFVAAALMWAMARWLGLAWPTTRAAWFRLTFSGALNLLIPVACNFVALKQVSVGTAAIITATNPLLLTLIAPKLLGERLTPRRFLGVLFGFGGVLFVMIARLGAGGKTDSPL